MAGCGCQGNSSVFTPPDQRQVAGTRPAQAAAPHTGARRPVFWDKTQPPAEQK